MVTHRTVVAALVVQAHEKIWAQIGAAPGCARRHRSEDGPRTLHALHVSNHHLASESTGICADHRDVTQLLPPLFDTILARSSTSATSKFTGAQRRFWRRLPRAEHGRDPETYCGVVEGKPGLASPDGNNVARAEPAPISCCAKPEF